MNSQASFKINRSTVSKRDEAKPAFKYNVKMCHSKKVISKTTSEKPANLKMEARGKKEMQSSAHE